MLNGVDSLELEVALLAWQEDRLGKRKAEDNVIAIDGKKLRSSQGQETVNAYAVKSGRWLGSEAVAKKSNEIPAARELIERLDLEGQRVTLDALHTNAETARTIVQEKGGANSFVVHWIMRQPNKRLATTTGFYDAMTAKNHQKAFSFVTPRKSRRLTQK